MTLDFSAAFYHEMLDSFVRAGFSRDEALYLCGEAMKTSMYLTAAQQHG